uniref:ATP-grasp domain-containing protein n=1 Tax=Parastrongyloides trichosuri TaxID=131310 RepID=A0A0N4Z8X5_PARTI
MSDYVAIIIGAWKNKVNLRNFVKHNKVKLIFVGPKELFVDNHICDYFFNVKGPSKITRKNDSAFDGFIVKLREVLSSFSYLRRYIMSFDNVLQVALSKLRVEFQLDGIDTIRMNQLITIKDMKELLKRGRISVLKHYSLEKLTEGNINEILTQLNCCLSQYPIIAMPLANRNYIDTSTDFLIVEAKDLKRWIIKRKRFNDIDINTYILEEYPQDGKEFTALISNYYSLIGIIISAFSTIPQKQLLNEAKPYSMEFLNIENVRNYYPGLEFFLKQIQKNYFFHDIKELLFIDGIYKNQNEIFIRNISFELNTCTKGYLIEKVYNSKSWQSLSLEITQTTFLHGNCDDFKYDESIISTNKNLYTSIINFPTVNGTLLHQQMTTFKAECKLQVLWTKVEGTEMLQSDSEDDNILQIIISHDNRDQFSNDNTFIMNQIEIAIDKTNTGNRSDGYRSSLPQLQYTLTAPLLRRSTFTHLA